MRSLATDVQYVSGQYYLQMVTSFLILNLYNIEFEFVCNSLILNAMLTLLKCFGKNSNKSLQ